MISHSVTMDVGVINILLSFLFLVSCEVRIQDTLRHQYADTENF